MRSALFSLAAGAALVLGLAGPAPAAPSIIDVSAASATGVNVFFEAGTYRITMAGVAGGGAYDAWNPWGYVDCTAENQCAAGWTNHFGVAGDFGIIDYIPAPPVNYAWSTALGSLHSWQTTSTKLAFFNGSPIGTVPYPDLTVFAQDTTLRFFIPDDEGAYFDNLGGVSLRVTAVPEPATWALMILGFAGVGASVRRRAVGCRAA